MYADSRRRRAPGAPRTSGGSRAGDRSWDMTPAAIHDASSDPTVGSRLAGAAASGDPARLALLEVARDQPTTLDGAWWPRSRELATELPSLVEEFARRGSRITHVVYHPGLWQVAPRKIRGAGGLVRLGWFREVDEHLISLRTSDERRIELLAVPPEASESVAARAMALATQPGNRLSPTAVLAAAQDGEPGGDLDPQAPMAVLAS